MAIAERNPLFNEILDFLVSAPGVEEILAFQPSALKQRSRYLMERNRQDALTLDERAELDEFLRMNHFMNMLKIRAREKQAGA
jgi:hypothetical protein